jgi:hypothetical protein
MEKKMKNIFINKNVEENVIESIGGVIWKKDGKNLAYFNHIGIWLKFERNENGFFLNKKIIDRFNGEQIYEVIKTGKLWFDFSDNAFKSKIRNTNLLDEGEIISMSVKSILTAISDVTGIDYSDEALIVSDVNLNPISSLPPLPSAPF